MNEDDLKAELELCRAEIRSLREELDDTNRGVVALYGELDVQAEKLRKATELKSHFLSYMSHEFRTPIGAIRSNARLLLDHVDGDRKSTRLNSSHSQISYAVFCLKKKKTKYSVE